MPTPSSVTMPAATPGGSVSRRDGFLIATCILLITALAWAYLLQLDHRMAASVEFDTMMAQMGMVMDATWGMRDVLFTFVMWALMMVGMMTPAAAPLLLLVAGAHARRGSGGAPVTVLMFGLGYLTVWFGFSACAALAQWALHEAAMLSSTMAASSTQLGGAILLAAGAYQLTPLKGRCLTHCQSPLGFLMANWREGPRGALRMGLGHGMYCLGCCWALMLVLFAVGIMNLVWVAALTVFVFIEKMGRTGAYVARLGAVLLIVAGVVLIATP